MSMRSDEQHMVKKEAVCDDDDDSEVSNSTHLDVADCSDQLELNFDTHINVIENIKNEEESSLLLTNSQTYMDMKSSSLSYHDESNEVGTVVKEESVNNEADCVTEESNTLSLEKEAAVTNANDVKCEICDKQFNWLHSKLHDDKLPDRVLCENCRQYLQKGIQLYECIECGKSFSQPCNLKTYKCILSGIEPENSKLRCTDCEKAFCELFVSKVLQRVHSDIKPFNDCDDDKSFSASQSAPLKAHEEKSTELTTVKPFKCAECDKSFTQRGHLKIHERIHSGIKPYKCKECDKSFVERGKLTVHKRVHSGIRPFKCDQCDKSFAERGKLNVHERIHFGITPYKCKDCDRTFAELCRLKEHERIHSGIKPHSCTECGRSFTKRYNLTVHERNVHSKKKLS